MFFFSHSRVGRREWADNALAASKEHARMQKHDSLRINWHHVSSTIAPNAKPEHISGMKFAHTVTQSATL